MSVYRGGVCRSINLADEVAELVRQAQKGNARAFEELIRRFERFSLSLAFGGTGDAQLAGEVVQEAFVRAWRQLGSLSEPERFGCWLGGIVRNVAADQLRARRREVRVLEWSVRSPGVIDPAAEAGKKEMRQRVADALGELDELARSVVVLRYYESLSSKQIGQALGLSAAAVDMRLMRAREALRQKLGPASCDEGEVSGRPKGACAER